MIISLDISQKIKKVCEIITRGLWWVRFRLRGGSATSCHPLATWLKIGHNSHQIWPQNFLLDWFVIITLLIYSKSRQHQTIIDVFFWTPTYTCVHFRTKKGFSFPNLVWGLIEAVSWGESFDTLGWMKSIFHSTSFIRFHNVILLQAFTPTSFDVHWGQHPLRPEFVESTYFLYQVCFFRKCCILCVHYDYYG